MTLRDDHYCYRVTWSEEDQEQLGLCAEFPSLRWEPAPPTRPSSTSLYCDKLRQAAVTG